MQRVADEAGDVVADQEGAASGRVGHQDQPFLGVRQRPIALATGAVAEAGRRGVLLRRPDRIERDPRRVGDGGELLEPRGRGTS